MFPLGTVLFPHAVLPLHVFEPRYRALTRAVLDGDQEFGVVLIERGSEVGGGDVRFDVGTLAHIVQASELADGRFALAVVGVSRLRVERGCPTSRIPRAEIVALDDDDDADATRRAAAGRVGRSRRRDAARGVRARRSRARRRGRGAAGASSPDPAQAAYEIAALAALGPLDAQRVLETRPTPDARPARVACDLLGDHAALLREPARRA